MNPTSTDNENKIEEIENNIISKTEKNYAQKVFEAIGDITGENGKIKNTGVWKQLNKINPNMKKQQPIPVAFKDKMGNLVTSPENIKDHCLKAIINRLRRRPIHPELKNLEKRKIQLANLRLKKAAKRKTPPWNIKQMQMAIKSLKNKKCRDSQGLINELLKPGVAGKDFQMSLLSLLNNTKKHLEIPHMMKIVNIALIPKPGKHNKLHHIESHRGIFLIHKFRSLIMRMLLNDKYSILDEFMSDSNVGGRKGRSIRDHLFIVNGIIHEHKNKSQNPITFQILDYSLCFDSMWYEEVANDLFEAGITDDKLSLLLKINESNEIAIKTPTGLTKRVNVEKIICQGDCWGSIECSLMVDGFGKESTKPDLEPYKYKNKVKIPLLGMVDDIFMISESGHKAQRLNGFINAKTAIKRLQFGPEKCHVMHIGKDIPEYKKMGFYVDGWKMKETENKETKEVFNGEEEIDESKNEKYLGQIISRDGSNVQNVENRANKGLGTVNKIVTTLENTPGGKYHFELAVIMRNALLISSMISCSEVWYHVTEWEYRKLEQTDEILLKKILNCSNQVSYEMTYLVLGLMPIRFIILLRRIIYLQQILKQKHRNTLLFKFFDAQLENQTKNDWVTQTVKDLEKVDINLELDEIEKMSDEDYEELCKTKVKKEAFKYLIEKKNKSETRKQIKFKHFEMAQYLQENEFGYSVKQRQFHFQCRVNDIEVKANRSWKYSDLTCRSCKIPYTNETQEHTLFCKALMDSNFQVTYLPKYSDLYCDDLQEQFYISTLIFENLKIRDEIK